MHYEMLKLQNQLCFPLYVCAKEVVGLYKPYLDEIGLTYTQYIAMMVLWEHQKTTVSQLGEFLYLDSGTITPMVKRLESKGLIRRERSQEDERQVYIHITDKGDLLKVKAAEIPVKIGQCISLSPEDARMLYEVLYKLLGQFSRVKGDEL